MSEPTPTQSSLAVFLKQRWLGILIVVLVAVFVLQNTGDLRVHLFWMTLTTPTWLLLAILFFLGVVAGSFRTSRKHRAKK
ncbi:Protein of unknown function [Sanguibacter gelidistatuariae]|uniref:Lipopolysaccharide assembly protein A domain-containing protein n=1 Tax=Sanguibacter gelidistatuariae TaxID=1814289 RepID=A0A1G6UG95_9MICO|nr:DUF1049 domain-containing protein [Sanguibacter gelidistatuariae]SDD40264.1 Protein of unknown function [Sanguibacter gelidistatuariae]